MITTNLTLKYVGLEPSRKNQTFNALKPFGKMKPYEGSKRTKFQVTTDDH
jgi:hypothetical protein